MTTPQDLQHVQEIVKRSGSSFYWAMRLLPVEQRDAMFAIYAFCREIDDIADSEAPDAQKLEGLRKWRDEIEALYGVTPPSDPTARALVKPIQEFGLEKSEFEELLNGMEMDIVEDMRAPQLNVLHLYCRRVAGAVGMLAIRVFGCADAEAHKFAEALGEALQLTNILRDVSEDARISRLYLPKEALEEAGIQDIDPEAVLRHPALPQAMASVALMAEDSFSKARQALAKTDKTKLRPAIIMMEGYYKILQRLTQRGWNKLEPRARLGALEMLGIALRLRVFGA